jgi:GT2 family glycosyltransferase
MKASLIILTYNELQEGTILCVESIYKYTNIDDFELIIVDNCSKDDTPRYLQKLKEKYSNIKIQLNEKNKGFAAGMNDGLKLAKGDFLVLLNNDILVTPDWLERLINPLIQNSEIGMIGPISNNSGNEQGVFFENLNNNNYIELTQDYTKKQQNEIYFTNRLAFFCVAIPRKVFEKIGFLDENFGLGWFEDDDYCLRVKNNGYKIAIAEDCFIFHHGSLSFGKGANTHAKQNELYFNKKHNTIWSLSNNALTLFEKIKFEVNNSDVKESNINIQRVSKRLECFERCILNMKEEEEKYRAYQNNLTIRKQIKELFKNFERIIRKKLRKK